MISGAGRGDPEVIILDAKGNKTTTKVSMRPRENGDIIEPQFQGSSDIQYAARKGSRSNGGGGGFVGNGNANGGPYGDGDGSEVTRVEYTATTLGLHSVNVFFAGKPIPGSPFGVKVGPGEQNIRFSLHIVCFAPF